MSTRKSVSKILADAAGILETRGFTTSKCYDPDTGGFCALGAIARAAYPKAKDEDIDNIAYAIFDDEGYPGPDPRYVEAVAVAAATISRRKNLPGGWWITNVVYDYNDSAKSEKQVVKMLRRASLKAAEAGK